MHLKTKIAEYGIIIKDNKFLMLRFSKEANVNEKWIFPGGRLNKTDKPKEALKREIKEETNLDIEIIKLLDVTMWGKEEDHRYAVFFLCKLIKGEIELSKEHQDYKWFKFKDKIDFHDKSFKEVLKKCQ
jgi:8-oxo-dGTP diphosphatase